MKILTKQQILMLHSQLIAETGGIQGLRDENLRNPLCLLPPIKQDMMSCLSGCSNTWTK
ncbi:MAG: hypothetical protein II920_06435 [Clostridia bacterium]|nr:hypothetical protein [Clostridia bacterium]